MLLHLYRSDRLFLLKVLFGVKISVFPLAFSYFITSGIFAGLFRIGTIRVITPSCFTDISFTPFSVCTSGLPSHIQGFIRLCFKSEKIISLIVGLFHPGCIFDFEIKFTDIGVKSESLYSRIRPECDFFCIYVEYNISSSAS